MTDLPGFNDPVAESQACFRAILDAMAHPGRICQAGVGLCTPPPLVPASGAVLLTLADADTPLWLGPGTEGAADWIQFHCGAPSAEPHSAAFALCLDLPSLAALNWGSHDGPEAGATLVLQCATLDAGPLLRLTGPGLREASMVRFGLPNDFARLWRPNRAAFPRGIDLILCSGTQVAALPRSIHVEAA